MLVCREGECYGTVGGGALERDAVRQALLCLDNGVEFLKQYQLSSNLPDSVGMICGGEVVLCFQPFLHTDEHAMELLNALNDCLSRFVKSWLILRLSFQHQPEAGLYSELDGLRYIENCVIDASLFRRKPVYLPGEPSLYTEPLNAGERVYLFGAGHVGHALVPLLANVGFLVTVLDERADMLTASRLPDADALVTGNYDTLASGLRVMPEDYIVILTPGHQADYAVLSRILKTPAGYIGCIGSRKKAAAIAERLRSDGFSDSAVLRIHSPIGLTIGAETPEEIAVSIAAEMIAHRAGLS